MSSSLKDPRSLRVWANFQQQVAAQGGEVLEPEYLGKDKPHRCLCAKGHECNPWPSSVRIGRGICRTCGFKASRIKSTLQARDNFYARVVKLGGVVIDLDWLGVDKPYLCRCVNNHECRPRAHDVLRNRGLCRICSGNDPATARSNFYAQITAQGGVVLEQRWLGSQQSHRCLCPAEHKCKPRPDGVRDGQNMCAICAGRDSDFAWENFREQVQRQGGTVVEPKWLGSLSSHRCKCSRGHDCRPKPNNVQQGHGICQVCSWKGHNAVYLVRNPELSWVKFGITRNDARRRLADHRREGFTECLYLKTELPENIAVHVEYKIKVALAMAGAKPMRGSEYFHAENVALIFNEIAVWIV